MQRSRLRVFILLFFLLQTQYSPAQDRTITPEIIASLKSVTETAISPDGRHIAYTVRTPSANKEKIGKPSYQIWIMGKDGKNNRPYTASEFNASSVTWMKDSQHIIFISQRGENDKNQLYSLSILGGEARALSEEKEGIGGYKLSPDETMIAFTRTDGKTDEEKDNFESGHDWNVVDRNFKFNRLYIYNLKERSANLLTTEDLHVDKFDWSPDSRKLVFTAAVTPLTDDTYMRKQIYTVTLSEGNPKPAVETKGKLGSVQFSPDGKYIAWTGAVDMYDPQSQSLFVASEGGPAINLTEKHKGSVNWFKWGNTGNILAVTVEKTSTYLYSINTKDGNRELLRSGRPIIHDIDFDARKKTYVFRGDTPFHPAEVFYAETGNKQARRMTRINPVLDSLKLADQMPVEYNALDGWLITGVVMKPVNFEKNKRYPLVISVHGGPESAVLDGWNTSYMRWGQLLAAEGYVVFWPNYRGSTGRGVDYSKGDQKDLGGQEFSDVIAGIDYLADDLKMVDKNKVGMGGGSYGGYFSALAATRYTGHFRAAVNFAGITNWISFMGTSDIPMENAYVHWGVDHPYDHMDAMWTGSPMKYIRDTKTAVLIVHGEKDQRVPIGQAHEMYTALKILDKAPYEMIIYPREGHGLGEFSHQVHFMTKIVDWYNQFLK
ncbi:MAG: prolyl oligopeptidase family serine peptidase [Calditrichaceae bacterium]